MLLLLSVDLVCAYLWRRLEALPGEGEDFLLAFGQGDGHGELWWGVVDLVVVGWMC